MLLIFKYPIYSRVHIWKPEPKLLLSVLKKKKKKIDGCDVKLDGEILSFRDIISNIKQPNYMMQQHKNHGCDFWSTYWHLNYNRFVILKKKI